MRGPARGALVVAVAMLVAPLAGAGDLKILTYNVGLLRVFGSDHVPLVEARAKLLPKELARLATDESVDVILLQEVWRSRDAINVMTELEALGYSAFGPKVRSALWLSSGLLLLVRAPLKVVDWDFERFTERTFIESFSVKGVLEATIQDPREGDLRFAVVGTHTVALDTKDGEPTKRKQLSSFMAQADQVLEAMERRSEGGTVPVLVLGDFNVGPGYIEAAYRKIADAPGVREAGAMVSPGKAFISWDPENSLVKYGRYPSEPPAKLDHIFLKAGGEASWRVLSARLVFQRPVDGLAIALIGGGTAVGVPLSDHYGFLVQTRLERP